MVKKLARQVDRNTETALLSGNTATARRLRGATDRGYLVNRQTHRGRPAWIVLADPMPEMLNLLPEPSELGA
jgi:hypothetical protein